MSESHSKPKATCYAWSRPVCLSHTYSIDEQLRSKPFRAGCYAYIFYFLIKIYTMAKKIIIPLSTKQEVKNQIYKMLETKESKKLIKKPKKIDIEKIFIKKTK
jgi:hypothetical protein